MVYLKARLLTAYGPFDMPDSVSAKVDELERLPWWAFVRRLRLGLAWKRYRARQDVLAYETLLEHETFAPEEWDVAMAALAAGGR